MFTIKIITVVNVAIIIAIAIGDIIIIINLGKCDKLLVHPTKRVYHSIFIHTDKGLVKCPQARLPYIFSLLCEYIEYSLFCVGSPMVHVGRVILGAGYQSQHSLASGK
jgi:hypothetical protein